MEWENCSLQLKYLPKERGVKTVTRFNEGKMMLYIMETRILVQVNSTWNKQMAVFFIYLMLFYSIFRNTKELLAINEGTNLSTSTSE